MRHTMKVAAVMSAAALTLAACGDSARRHRWQPAPLRASAAAKSDSRSAWPTTWVAAATSRSTTPPRPVSTRPRPSSASRSRRPPPVNGENEAAREERLQQLVDAGYTHVVAVGFAYAKSVGKVAKANPDVHFAIVDDASQDSAGPTSTRSTFAEKRARSSSVRPPR